MTPSGLNTTGAETAADEQRSALRDLVRHTLVYGSGYVTMAIVSFVLVPVYTRHMSPSEYGLLGHATDLDGQGSTVKVDFNFVLHRTSRAMTPCTWEG
jgi:hypothetical protein